MKQCLVTQLDSNFSDYLDLPKYNTLIINAKIPNDTENFHYILTIINYEDFEVSVSSNGSFKPNGTGSTPVTHYIFPKNETNYIRFQNGEYRISITKKYTLKHFQSNTLIGENVFPFELDIEQFRYSTRMTGLLCPKCGLRGNLSSLSLIKTFEDINISGNYITGELSNLCGNSNLFSFSCYYNDISGTTEDIKNISVKLTNLTLLNGDHRLNITGSVTYLGYLTQLEGWVSLLYNNITGSVEEFVQVQRANGRTTGTINHFSSSSLSYNGSIFTINDKKLQWTADSISIT